MTPAVRLTTRAERETLRSIKRACYAGLDSVTLRQEVGRRAAAIVPAEAYGLMAHDPDTGLFTHGWAERLSGRYLQSYIEEVYPSEIAEFIDLARSGLTTSLHSSEPSMELLRAEGLEHTLHAALCVEEEMWGSWCLFREPSSRSFGEREARFLRAVAPHVARGLKAAAAIEAAREGAGAAEGSGPGVIVLDGRSRIVLRSGPASAQLGDLADVGHPAETLPSAVVSVLAQLRAERACTADPLPLSTGLRTQGRSGLWYALRASRAEPDESGESATVVVIEPATPRDPVPILAQRYGLTPREREVVLRAARGDSTKQIAARLGLSVHTVQHHLNHAGDKVGARGRKALLARLFFDSAAPPGG
ncbi:MAG TPA: helix-turn-helix transcriptional regulator [Longimicrobiaceae bacterium]|nr:helix-turn-helix transcriptional regulator [Longimicrobiaceae bacterium]